MESGSGDAIGARPSRNNRRYPGKIKRIGNQFEMNEQSDDKHSSNERATERERVSGGKFLHLHRRIRINVQKNIVHMNTTGNK